MSEKIYLLAGNGSYAAWWDDCLPFFQQKIPIPVELPGSGSNRSERYRSLDELAEALLEQTEAGQEIFAVGVNALVVLHALVRQPRHFSKVMLLAPVGAFLWERSFVKLMSLPPLRKTIHFLLKNFPKIFARKFSSRRWTDAQYQRMAEGYRQCVAFEEYFRIVKPHNALRLFEWIDCPIELIWGRHDAVLGIRQAAAWDSILPRAALSITIQEDWEHYPYIDAPQAFADFIENHQPQFPAHSKAGRLQLAQLAGLPVPKAFTLRKQTLSEAFLNQLDPTRLFAVRSSGAAEDQIDYSHAGRHHSFLQVPFTEVLSKATQLFESGLEEVVVQEFVHPQISGVAFTRSLAAEVELVEGHLEALLSGKIPARSFILSKMSADWALAPNADMQALFQKYGFSTKALWDFLQQCIKAFHYQASDIEWAWNAQGFHLLQIRPVTQYLWRRNLTSANLDEILPAQVSRLMEHAQRHAAQSIGQIYALWDTRVLNDNEPFTSIADDNASYINSDLFLARFQDWGLPSSLYAREIGGAVPHLPFHLGKALRSIPIFLKMQSRSRAALPAIAKGLQGFANELAQLQSQKSSEERFVNFFERYYIFIVQSNILINNCISTSFGRFLGKRSTVYEQLAQAGHSPHRIAYESDPATPRQGHSPALQDFPQWPWLIRWAHRLLLPGLLSYYFEVREWFRDNNMRLFHQLHLALQGSQWFLPHEGVRRYKGSFWQSGGESSSQNFSFVIYGGSVEGILGQDILVVDALEPGHFEAYKQAKAVIARVGGRLSHGATLLRELRKPSAVLSDFPKDFKAQKVRFSEGKIYYLESSNI
jgi:pimeloyl-ACP methyl ester carboxylesterase